jgi:hypothetical protein
MSQEDVQLVEQIYDGAREYTAFVDPRQAGRVCAPSTTPSSSSTPSSRETAWFNTARTAT